MFQCFICFVAMFAHQRLSSVNVFSLWTFKHHQIEWNCILIHFVQTVGAYLILFVLLRLQSPKKHVWFHSRSTCPFYLLQHGCSWCLCLFEWHAGGWNWWAWWVEAAECQGLLPRRHSRWAVDQWMIFLLDTMILLKAWLCHLQFSYHCSVIHYHHRS